MADWIRQAREAARAGQSTDAVEVVRGRRPPALDADGSRMALAPMLAAIAWAGAVFREAVSGSPIDPVALLLRAIALGFTVRAALGARKLWRRGRLWLEAPRHHLAIAEDGILWHGPEGEIAIARDDVLSVAERGDWRRSRPSAGQPSPVPRSSTTREGSPGISSSCTCARFQKR